MISDSESAMKKEMSAEVTSLKREIYDLNEKFNEMFHVFGENNDKFNKLENMFSQIMGEVSKTKKSTPSAKIVVQRDSPNDMSRGNSPIASDGGDLDITTVFGVEPTRNTSGRRTVFPETKNNSISTTYYQQVEPFSCKLASSYYSVARSFFNAAYIHAEMHNSSVPFVQANMSSEVQAAVMSHAKIDAQQFAVLSLQSVMSLTLRYMAPTTAKQYIQALRATVAQVMNIQMNRVVPSVNSTNFKRLMDEASSTIMTIRSEFVTLNEYASDRQLMVRYKREARDEGNSLVEMTESLLSKPVVHIISQFANDGRLKKPLSFMDYLTAVDQVLKDVLAELSASPLVVWAIVEAYNKEAFKKKVITSVSVVEQVHQSPVNDPTTPVADAFEEQVYEDDETYEPADETVAAVTFSKDFKSHTSSYTPSSVLQRKPGTAPASLQPCYMFYFNKCEHLDGKCKYSHTDAAMDQLAKIARK